MRNKKINGHLVAFVCGLLLVGVVACEKMRLSDNGSKQSEQADGQLVTVSVNSFEQIPFNSVTRAAVGDVCSRLNFIIYDDSGTRIRQVSQTLEDEDFGQARFNLSNGSYLLVVLAHSSSGNPTSTNPKKIAFSNSKGYTDTFLGTVSLTVNDEDIEKTLSLKRIVAKVRFVFDDAVPERANRIRFYYTGGSGTLDATDSGWGSVNSTQIQYYDLTHSERDFEIYTIPHGAEDKLKVTVNTYQGEAEDANIVTEREITDIPVLRNHITTCYGSLFAPVYKTNFKITIDDSWEVDSLDFQF